MAGGGRARGPLGAGAEGSPGRRVGRDPRRRRSERLAGGGPGASLSPSSGGPAPRQVLPGRLPPAEFADGTGRIGPRSCAVGPGSLRVLSPLAWHFRVRVWLRKQGRETVVFEAILTLPKRTGQTPTWFASAARKLLFSVNQSRSWG